MSGEARATPPPILSVLLRSEHDVVTARQRARDIAALLGFDRQDQTRIATAVSEIARNAVSYARNGKVEFLVEDAPGDEALVVRITDTGPGMRNLKAVLEGRYKSKTGLGQGMIGARRLMDGFEAETSTEGTRVMLRKKLPRKTPHPTRERLAALGGEIDKQAPRSLLDELRHENQELLHAMEELRRRQDELNRLNSELEETNRGVVALYAELDERAEHLKRANQTKLRFLSHVSHEFRTPLNSIMALSRLLLNQVDGPLLPEQQKQVTFMRQSAASLLEIVNDLLDLSRVEAGKSEVRPTEVHVATLFGTLRGMMRPLLTNEGVSLLFEEPEVPSLITDESKLAQILRNFISNALKYTERGEVRVKAERQPDDRVTFSVSDTGIGIRPEDRERIFQEFVQIENPLQGKVKGTGLGLSLTAKLAELLGGSIDVESRPGEGSTFSVTLPVGGREAERRVAARKLLIVDDEEISRYLIRQSLDARDVVFVEAVNGVEGLAKARKELPDVIFLDLRMPEMDGFEVLRRLKADPATRGIPVIVITSKSLEASERAELERGAAAVLSKEVLISEQATHEIHAALTAAGVQVERIGPANSMIASKGKDASDGS
ncbi:MAG TPA: ATP-binding protein [Bryobacteraceae bacterium]|nr:ATP-binding protein [Bryobacteraceae bacterium]